MQNSLFVLAVVLFWGLAAAELLAGSWLDLILLFRFLNLLCLYRNMKIVSGRSKNVFLTLTCIFVVSGVCEMSNSRQHYSQGLLKRDYFIKTFNEMPALQSCWALFIRLPNRGSVLGSIVTYTVRRRVPESSLLTFYVDTFHRNLSSCCSGNTKCKWKTRLTTNTLSVYSV